MTGEMSSYDVAEGGEHYEWAQHIRTAAQQVARRSLWAVRFIEMCPFDVYQGPYAELTTGRLRGGDAEHDFYWERYCGDPLAKAGSVATIAEHLRKLLKAVANAA